MKKFIFGFVVGIAIAVSMPAMADLISYTALGEARDALARVTAMETLFKLDCGKTRKRVINEGTWRETVEHVPYCVKRP